MNVCKSVFCCTLGISKSRVSYVMNKKKNSGFDFSDLRGKKTVSPESVETIRSFMETIPKYKSRYHKNLVLHFPSEVTMRRLHNIYSENLPGRSVSRFIFMREIHNLRLTMSLPRKDNCLKCDEILSKLKGPLTERERKKILEESKQHKKKSEYACDELKLREEQVKLGNNRLLCFTFNVEKTQQIPCISDPSMYYKRQMWLYNMSINTRHNNKGFMCVWQEIEGRMGSNEITSSLLAFLQQVKLEMYDEIHTFSNACESENAKKNLVFLLMFICQRTTINCWTHTVFENGHPGSPNDPELKQIDKIRKKKANVYTADEWIAIIEQI